MNRRDFLRRAWQAPVAAAGGAFLPGLFKSQAPQNVINITGATFRGSGYALAMEIAKLRDTAVTITNNTFLP